MASEMAFNLGSPCKPFWSPANIVFSFVPYWELFLFPPKKNPVLFLTSAGLKDSNRRERKKGLLIMCIFVGKGTTEEDPTAQCLLFI